MKQGINTLFITALVVSNVITGKILNIFGLIVPGAVICYAFTFLFTDLLSEMYGKKEAQKTVIYGLTASLFAAIIIKLTQYLPAAEFALERSRAYDIILGSNMRFVLASLLSYFVSQTWDVWIFHKIKHATNGKKRWLRNNVSTITSQLLDTSIFITIAFWNVVPNLWWMIVSQYLIKIIIALIDTIPFYLITTLWKLIKPRH